MKNFADRTDGSNFGAGQRGSGMSSLEGLSGFRDDTGHITDEIMFSEKMAGLRDGGSQITGGNVSTSRDPSKNDNIQKMYDRVMGVTSGDDQTQRTSNFLLEQQHKT